MYRIEPLLPNHMHLITPILASYGYKPYRAYMREFGASAVSDFFVASVEERLGSEYTRAFCAFSDNQIEGLVIWTTLEQESQQFGFRAARIDYLMAVGDYGVQRKTKGTLLAELQSQCASERIQHLSIRIDAPDWSSIHSLEEHGFILTDGLITYGRNLRDGSWLSQRDTGYEIRPASPADLPQLKELARSAFTFDRLHADPAIHKSVADEIHAAWLENSCSSSSADWVLVAADEAGILGYSVCRVNNATIPYFGEPIGIWVIAATAERARGRGLAKSLCLSMFDWQRDRGVRFVEGGTQLANIASARLHESCGFRVVASSLSMSKWIGAIE